MSDVLKALFSNATASTIVQYPNITVHRRKVVSVFSDMRMNATDTSIQGEGWVRKARTITKTINMPRSPRSDKYKAA